MFIDMNCIADRKCGATGPWKPGGYIMERMTAKDFDQELLDLYDGYAMG